MIKHGLNMALHYLKSIRGLILSNLWIQPRQKGKTRERCSDSQSLICPCQSITVSHHCHQLILEAEDKNNSKGTKMSWQQLRSELQKHSAPFFLINVSFIWIFYGVLVPYVSCLIAFLCRGMFALCHLHSLQRFQGCFLFLKNMSEGKGLEDVVFNLKKLCHKNVWLIHKYSFETRGSRNVSLMGWAGRTMRKRTDYKWEEMQWNVWTLVMWDDRRKKERLKPRGNMALFCFKTLKQKRFDM